MMQERRHPRVFGSIAVYKVGPSVISLTSTDGGRTDSALRINIPLSLSLSLIHTSSGCSTFPSKNPVGGSQLVEISQRVLFGHRSVTRSAVLLLRDRGHAMTRGNRADLSQAGGVRKRSIVPFLLPLLRLSLIRSSRRRETVLSFFAACLSFPRSAAESTPTAPSLVHRRAILYVTGCVNVRAQIPSGKANEGGTDNL